MTQPDNHSSAAHRSLDGSVGRWLGALDPRIARILDRALDGHEVTIDEGASLFETAGREMQALLLVADELRRQTVGDVVTYVLNRNINFTNVCVKRCGFCAFSRGHLEEQGYFLPIGEVVRRAREAWDLGATEVCIQAGLPPQMDGSLYLEICHAIKRELPDIHIHGFSPEEVLYGSARSRCSIEEYLGRLKDAGVGSLPGTSAEILDEEVRDVISHGRISVANWVKVITSAHRLGIPTTSTIMYGHVESTRHRAAHIALLRDIQRETGGITEFVPLSFVHTEAPMFRKGLVPGVRSGATGNDIMKMYAVARVMLHGFIKNIQVSWVKEGTKFAQACLAAGANDVGGTLINESISTSAGAANGQFVRPAELRALIRDAGRIPAERSTTYQIRRLLTDEPAEPDLLDTIEDTDRFGSYQRLIAMEEFRYRPGIARAAVARRQDAFCSRFTERLDKKSEQMTEREGNIKERVTDRMSRRTDRRDSRDVKFDEKREKQDARRALLYTKLEGRADTDAEKAALVEFKKTMDTAVSTRRAAFDKAIEDFRTAVDNLIDTRKSSTSDNYAKFRTTVDRATAEAKADCEANVDQKTVMSEYQTAMKAAREAMKTDKGATEKIGDDIRALAATKKAAMESAMNEFKKTAETAREKLKSALKAASTDTEAL